MRSRNRSTGSQQSGRSSEKQKLTSNHKKELLTEGYHFKAIRCINLDCLFRQIVAMEDKEYENNMFPSTFAKTYSSELKTPIFEIEVKDKYKTWRILKRLPELVELEETLKAKYCEKIFSIPFRDEAEITTSYQDSILELFATFLNSIVQVAEVRAERQFLRFIEAWVPDDKKKMKNYLQLRLYKKAGGRHTESNLQRLFKNFASWRHKFFSICSEGVYYTDNEDGFQIREMLLFNQSFIVLHGEVKTGYSFGIIINSSHRILQIDAENVYNFLLFVYSLRTALNESENSKVNRYDSFAKVRAKCHSQFYIDGEDYFGELYRQIKAAKREIFITGWFLAVYMYLLRPCDEEFEDSRLDRILKTMAMKGVKIFIVIYNAPKIALNNEPEFVIGCLSGLHPNIKVLSHPHYLLIPFLWSHHEKSVIIDQKVGFLGGLDIAHGRMDNKSHKLSDASSSHFPGIQYCNFRIRDIQNPQGFEKSEIDRKSQPRMPWHDVAVKIEGLSVLDLTRHFIQYWNYVNFQLSLDQRELIAFTGFDKSDMEGLIEEMEEIIEESSEREKSTSSKSHHGELYGKYVESDDSDDALGSQDINIALENQKRVSEDQRHHQRKEMSEQEIMSILMATRTEIMTKTVSFSAPSTKSLSTEELPMMGRMMSTQFTLGSDKNSSKSKLDEIQYYRQHLKENKDRLSMSPKKQQSLQSDSTNEQPCKKQKVPDLVLTETSEMIGKGIDSDGKLIDAPTSQFELEVEAEKCKQFNQSHQILRSASLWGLGLQEGKEQKSILQAYCNLISEAEHFVYIENQFFISVQNYLTPIIAERIVRANKQSENFKLVIVIPFLPGFQGEIDDQSSGSVLRVQIDLVYKSICRGPQSLFEQLNGRGVANPEEYLQIFCLRSHGKVCSKPTTEIVYVHSKVLIVDDKIALIGSANINDRSLMGDRDSELAIVVEDQQQLTISPGSSETESQHLPVLTVKKFAHNLRVELFMEHFGLKEEEVSYFLSPRMWDLIQFNAERNQKIYRKLFGCYPDSEIRKFADVRLLRESGQSSRYDELAPLLKGSACPFQTDFLSDERLELKKSQKQYYLPYINFT